jgi:hypothetical protein
VDLFGQLKPPIMWLCREDQLLRKSSGDATTEEQLAVTKYRERLLSETVELLEVVSLMTVDEGLKAAANV